MTIDGINFNKLPKKTDVNKTQKEAPKGPSVEPEMTEAEKTALAKLRDSALAGYVLGLMKVAGGAAAVGGTAATLQSCGDITQEQNVDIDMAPILEKLDAMMKLMQQSIQQQQEMLAYLQEMNSDNKELIKLVKDIINQNKEISSILQSIDGTTQSIEAAMIRVVALLEEANANDVEFLNKLDAIINGQADAADKLDQILQANKEQNQLLINIEKLLDTLKETNQNIYNKVDDIYNSFQEGNTSHSEMLEQILAAIQNNGNISSDILKAINDLSKQLANGQITESEMIAQIINLLASIDSKLDSLQSAVDNIRNEFPDLSAKIDEFINKYQDGELAEHALLASILEEIKKTNAGGDDISNKLDAILNAINNGQMTDQEALSQIIEILGQIKNDTGSLVNILNKLLAAANKIDESITVNGQKLSDQITNYVNQYNQDKIEDHELLQKIIDAINSSNLNDASISNQLNAILNAINNGQINTNQALDKITQILSSIEANTSTIIDAINKISGQLDNLNANFENNQEAILDALENINNGVGSVDSKLDKIIANQEKNNETTTEISQKLDEITAQLEQINSKTLTIDQVKTMLGPVYEELKEYLNNIAGNQITVGDLEAALEAHKTDLTRTNALIETLVNLVANLDLDGDSDALKEITDAIKDFQNSSNANNEQVIANLKEVLDKLAGMQGSLDAIVETGNTIKDNLDKYMASATTYGNKLFNEIQKIGNNMVDKTTLQVYADSYTEYLQKAEQQRQEQLAVLQAIFENMGKGDGGSLTIDELKQIIPDYSDILNEISEKIGKVITSEDLENFFVNTKPDLTRTNALIETLVNLVANLDPSGSGNGSSIDTSTLQSLVDQILTEIKGQNPPTEDQMRELIDLIKQAQTPPSTETRSAGGTYYHQGWKYN